MNDNHNPFNHFSILIFSVGVLIGVAIVGAWIVQGAITIPSTKIPVAATSTNPYGKSAAISVSDQAAGDQVLIDTVTVPPPGVWVAIREMTLENELGNVLGAARVRTPSSNVVVSLLRGTLPGQSYAVVLYRADNGEEFDPSLNSLYIDFDTGERVVVPFKTAQ